MDVYGIMLKEGNPDAEFHVERDDGYFTPYSYKEWLGLEPVIPEWEKEVFKHLKKGSVLDIGCGTGKHVAYLNNQGFQASGIDTSEGAIKIGQEYKRPIQFKDFWSFDENEKFDNVIIMDSTVGFIAHPEKMQNFFEKIHQITHPSSRILLTSINWPEATNEMYRKYVQKNQEQAQYPGKVRLRFKIGEFIGDWFEGHYYDMDSLLRLAVKNNFYPRWINYTNGIKYTLVLENRIGKGFSF